MRQHAGTHIVAQRPQRPCGTGRPVASNGLFCDAKRPALNARMGCTAEADRTGGNVVAYIQASRACRKTAHRRPREAGRGPAPRCGMAEAGVRGALLAIRINTPQAGNTFETALSPSLNHRVTRSSRVTHNFAPGNRNQQKKYEDGKKSINDGGHGRKRIDRRMGGDRGRSRPRGGDRAHH